MAGVAPEQVREQVRLALVEDLGDGDRTAGLVPEGARSRVELLCREPMVLCGRAWFDEAFRQLDPAVSIDWRAEDGERFSADSLLCRLEGNSRALLSAERTALNFLQTLSGTATLARRYADEVAGTGVRVLDTRKTLPGLRLAQKYAVACGGCHNHRIGLYDAILIKENHIQAAGSIAAALQAARRQGGGVPVEIEVESLDELQQALQAGANHMLLDNFTLDQLREAVRLAAGRARLEASGNMSLERLRQVAETGVDDISVGALTKDVRAIDLSLRFHA